MVPALLGDPAVPLDDHIDDLLLAGADVDDLHLAVLTLVLEAEDEVSPTDIPRTEASRLFTLLLFFILLHIYFKWV